MRGHDPHLAAATPNANRQRSLPQLHSTPRGGHSDRAPRNRHSGLLWVQIDRLVQAEHNAFLMCDKFEQPSWVELLPTEGPDSDAFDEELYTEFP